MRDILVSCFSENAVNVISQYSSASSSSSSSFSCSTYSKNACISPTLTPSIQNSISCVYKIVLCTQKNLLATVTWCNNNNNNQGFSITFENEKISSSSFRLNTNSRFFRKKKGSRILESEDLKIEIFWDLSNAKYDPSGPEPVEGFSVVILIDSEIGLILGDVGQETVTKKLKSTSPSMAKVSLISRREYCSGNTLYATKAQFCERGIWHDVVIKCSNNHGEEEEEEDEEKEEGLKLMKKKKMMMMMTCPPPYVMSVCIDKKTVIRVKRLKWNFRGNQTIFVDGLLVDLLWDVHDWFFNNPSSNSNSSGNSGVFMFRTRSGLDSRLWLEEKNMAHRDKDLQFSFFIYACKNT